MNNVVAIQDNHRANGVLTATIVTVALVACLYWARAIIIPFAVAVFLTFILNPPIIALQRLRLARGLSVCLVVAGATCIVGLIFAVISWQVAALVQEMPKDQHVMEEKLASMRAWFEQGRLGALVRDIEMFLQL